MNINYAKFDQNLDCTSFSRQLPYGPLFLVSHVVNGQDVRQRSLCDIPKDGFEGDNVLYESPLRHSFRFTYKNRVKTTLNWDIGPYIVYLHAVDIINQLRLALLPKNKRNTSPKEKEENDFT